MNKTQAKAIILETVRVIPSVLPYLSDKTRAAIKAGYISGGVPEINARYNKEIVAAMTTYFEGGASTAPRNQFRQAMTEAFNSAMDTGWIDGGQKLPLDEDAAAWLQDRISQEAGFIGTVFEQIKELRKDAELDFFAWVTRKADGYTGTVSTIYNQAKLFADKNKMLTFVGEDGDPNHICQSINGTCVRMKGKRHKASWWIAHDLIPYPGNTNFDCGAWRCQHYLEDDNGKRFTL